MSEVIYPPCKYCGATHGMGIENMETGVIEPMDVCRDCLFPPVKESMNPIEAALKEWEEKFEGKYG